MSFSTDMDKAINNMTSGQKAAVKSAFTTLETAMNDEFQPYESSSGEQTNFRESLLDFARELAVRMQ